MKDESVVLQHRESDNGETQEFRLQLVRSRPKAGNRWLVNFQYGRSGSKLRRGIKTPKPVSYEEAAAAYERLLGEKLQAGYRIVDDGELGPLTREARLKYSPIVKVVPLGPIITGERISKPRNYTKSRSWSGRKLRPLKSRPITSNAGASGRTPWRWREGRVAQTSEHFELRYGEASKGGWYDWTPVALVGRVSQGLCSVEFLIDRGDSRNSKIVKEVVNELNFYLVEKGEPQPWGYLQYHCGTMSNVYSSVHWGFLPSSAEALKRAGARTKNETRRATSNSHDE
jgi:hypothetical protein